LSRDLITGDPVTGGCSDSPDLPRCLNTSQGIGDVGSNRADISCSLNSGERESNVISCADGPDLPSRLISGQAIGDIGNDSADIAGRCNPRQGVANRAGDGSDLARCLIPR